MLTVVALMIEIAQVCGFGALLLQMVTPAGTICSRKNPIHIPVQSTMRATTVKICLPSFLLPAKKHTCNKTCISE